MPAQMRVVVDMAEEKKFRRRALRRMPNEYLEAMFGYEKNGQYVICAFEEIEHESTPKGVSYDPSDLAHAEKRAAESGMVLLGTIHSHPNRTEGMFSEMDARDVFHSGEKIFGILAIDASGKRRKCVTCYWPGVHLLDVEYRQLVSSPKSDRARERRIRKKLAKG
jgi:proteasome lid subunit RPN8/RPN11